MEPKILGICQAMDLDLFLERIGIPQGVSLGANRTTLDQLMVAHTNAVTFENLNQQLGRRVTLSLEDIFKKVVEDHRGGWCFELNSLFAWALEQLGFEVQMLAGQVGRQEGAPVFLANHMLLRVDLDEPLLVDVGFGCGLARSIPLLPGTQMQPPYDVSVSELSDGYLRYSEHVRGEPATYDFTLEPVTTSYFDDACERLQTDPESPFLRTLTAQRRESHQHLVLRGLVWRVIGQERTEEQVFASQEQLLTCLNEAYGLDMPEIADIWPDLLRRHEELFGSG